MVGIDAKNKHIIDPKFICPKCTLILRDPVQLSICGHGQCQSCFDTEPRSTIICLQCQTELQRTQVLLDRGFRNDMQSLPTDCSFCEWTDVLSNYQKHLDLSHSNPKCEYCDQQFNAVNELNQHKLSECQKLTIHRILKDYGCNKLITRDEKDEHYLSQQHQDAILKIVRLIQSQVLVSQVDAHLSQATTAMADDPVTTPLQELYGTRNILTDDGEALNDDGQRLRNESLQTLPEDFSQVQLSMEESPSFLQGIRHNQNILNQDLASLKEKIDDMQHVSYDGTFVWKITNLKEKMRDAQSERQTSIYSPPFYSSPTGYKMRARLYLHGDGNARRTHMSLFFVLMRSEYDAILQFPFTYKVTFCLYDQSGAERHIIDSFRPDVRSNSFQRPRCEMNIASGIPKFFPLSIIEQEGNPYVRDDTMFIKIMVDFGDMARSLLPFALSLNPGLPTHVQRAMVKEAVERQAK